MAELFGTGSHGVLYGIVLFSGSLGGAVGPVLAGRIFDVTESYALAFTALAALASIGLVLVLRLPASNPGPGPGDPAGKA